MTARASMQNPLKPPGGKPLTPARAGRLLGRFIGRQVQKDVIKQRKDTVLRRLKPIGLTLDRIVTLMVVAIVITYGLRLLFYVLTR
jgi:hypothetical protein